MLNCDTLLSDPETLGLEETASAVKSQSKTSSLDCIQCRDANPRGVFIRTMSKTYQCLCSVVRCKCERVGEDPDLKIYHNNMITVHTQL